jgi:glycosyltransferase involved in cell wall biosynthesis
VASRANLRIALNQLGGLQWTGGITYKQNLICALRTFQSEAELLLVGGSSEQAEGLRLIPAPATGGTGRAIVWRLARRILQVDYPLKRAIAPFGVNVIFPSGFSVGRDIASIYWIPDFQFMHLPHLYTAPQLRQTESKLRRYFEQAARVLVSSNDAAKDLAQFAPEIVSKARVLPFVAHVPQGLYEDNPSAVLRRYHLPPDFIYLPNQFWAHKNHELVFRALSILRHRDLRPMVVCSGNPVDVRAPQHFAGLLSLIAELGIRDQVALLGLVPHRDVYGLIRQSKCVLNPSLFEGWSTSVEEAKSVGKRVLVSDLPVHIEQLGTEGIYFDRRDPAALADCLEKVWKDFSAGPDTALEWKARQALPDRMAAFGSRFIQISREAAESVS